MRTVSSTMWPGIQNILGGLVLLLVPAIAATAQTDAPQNQPGVEYFETHIRPLLIEHCLECHGADPDKIRGGLWMNTRQQLLEGGDSGPALVPGDPDASLLMEAVHYQGYEMPPAGQLPDESIARLATWISMGAPDPRTGGTRPDAPSPGVDAGREHWAFQPVASSGPTPETVPSSLRGWIRTDVDRFLVSSWEAQGLRPVEDTDRATLLRRAHLVLTGLPPSADEIEAFTHSQQSVDQDLAEVVDRLLASPHYGERWGRHWLDVARFAESSGGGRSLMFPEAWRYRDYVIDAFNRDQPFDQFVREQIAGDLLPAGSQAERNRQIVASGFLALGPTNYEQQDKELLRMEVIDEQVNTIGRAFLALTLGCARCHDHKFDPIPTEDYYALAGIFGSTVSLVDGNVSGYVTTTLATDAERDAVAQYRERLQQLNQQLAAAEKKLAQLTGQTAERQSGRRVKSKQLAGIVVDDLQAELVGAWTASTSVHQFVDQGYRHDDNRDQGKKKVIFRPRLEQGGRYEVRLAYSAGGNRASNVRIAIDHQDGQQVTRVNQSREPSIDGLFVSLGTYRFEANNVAAVTISNADADGYVIADAVQWIRQTDASANATSAPGETAVALGEDDPSDDADLDSESVEVERARQRVERLDRELRELKADSPRPLDQAMSVRDAQQPADGHVHIRGSVRNLGPVVPRGFLRVIDSPEQWPSIGEASSGRLELADWIARPDHPLTARVYVNRVWRHVFGRGLVESTDNFGAMGRRPSHPELLDHLARGFVEQGWSTKQLIRELLSSHAFRLSSETDETNRQRDPENRLLWRANRRRLDAEVLRDSILSVSGQLDPTAGGRTIRKIKQYDLGYEFDSRRRSVYVPWFRNSMLDLFEVFDVANPNMVVGDRNTSTLPTQALFLMNSPWVIEQSGLAAERLIQNAPHPAPRLELAYQRILGRAPTSTEARASMEYLSQFPDDPESIQRGWTSLVHALFGSLDFRYVH